MTSTEYICSILDLDKLLELQAACNVLKEYGLHDVFVLQHVNAELERRTE